MQKVLPFIKSFLQPDQFAGLSWEICSEGGQGQLVILQKDKDEVYTQSKAFDLKSIEALATAIPKNIPVILNVHGKGILHKFIHDPIANGNQLLQQIFPNARLSQFYIQTMPTTAGVLASVIRRDSLDTLLNRLQAADIWITGLSLGPFTVRYLLPFLKQPSSVILPTHQLHFDASGLLYKMDANSGGIKSYQLGDEHWPNKSLCAYASAFCGIMQISPGLEVNTISFQLEEFYYKQLFEVGKKLVLGLLLGILVINTFAYYFYKNKNNDQQSQLVQTKAILIELDSLKTQVNRQQDLFQRSGINQQSQASYYADRIGASLPKGVQLTELYLFPMDGNERNYDENALRRYHQNEIRVKGVCSNSLTYNQWIKQLGVLTWVKEARHLNYKDLNKSRGEFELRILIAPSQ